jgi:CHAD domain-containing protein
MNSIIKSYNLLVKNYHEIETDSTENGIHDKRVILRRIFPILGVYKMKPLKVKNGEKAFRLFGKLRDVQVQISKLGSIDQAQELTDYLMFLKEREMKLNEKVSKFCKKKELVFPSIKHKSKISKSKILSKSEKMLNKIILGVQSGNINVSKNIHKTRIEFKKFRYVVEILSNIENIDTEKLDNLKPYQNMLGEIQDYEILIKGIEKYSKKLKLDDKITIEELKEKQNVLIGNFNNQIESFIKVCRDVLSLNKDVLSLNKDVISSNMKEADECHDDKKYLASEEEGEEAIESKDEITENNEEENTSQDDIITSKEEDNDNDGEVSVGS